MPLVLELVDRLETAGIRYCFLRGAGTEPAVNRHVEIDVLVDPRDLKPWTHTTSALGFVPIPLLAQGGHRFYTGYDQAADVWVKLDVVTELRYGDGGRCLNARGLEGVLERAANHPPRQPDPEDALLMLVLHGLLDKGRIKDVHRALLADLGREIATDESRARSIENRLHQMFGRTLSWPELSSAIERGDWDALLARRDRIARALVRRSPLTTLRRAIAEGLLRMARPAHLAFGRRGFAIALVGPDGAGKSSLSHALSEDPEIRAQTIYLGTNPHGGAGRPEPSMPGPLAAEPRTKNGSGLPTRLVRQWRRSVAGWFLTHRGRFVVYDRHPWEGRLAPDRGFLARTRRAVLTFVCPRPDLFVVLDVPAEALHARAPEHSHRRAEDHVARYRRLAQIVPGAVVVDASAPLGETRVRLTRLIWDRYYHHVTGAPLVRS